MCGKCSDYPRVEEITHRVGEMLGLPQGVGNVPDYTGVGEMLKLPRVVGEFLRLPNGEEISNYHGVGELLRIP